MVQCVVALVTKFQQYVTQVVIQTNGDRIGVEAEWLMAEIKSLQLKFRWAVHIIYFHTQKIWIQLYNHCNDIGHLIAVLFWHCMSIQITRAQRDGADIQRPDITSTPKNSVPHTPHLSSSTSQFICIVVIGLTSACTRPEHTKHSSHQRSLSSIHWALLSRIWLPNMAKCSIKYSNKPLINPHYKCIMSIIYICKLADWLFLCARTIQEDLKAVSSA